MKSYSRRNLLFALLPVTLIVLAVFFNQSVDAGAGDLDSGFGSGGIVTTHIEAFDNTSGLVIQANGKIVATGIGGTDYVDVGDFAAVRYNYDGTLDSSFDSDGIATADFGGYDFGMDSALQADGKIVIVGSSDAGGNLDFALARFNMNGSLDSSFSGDGLQTTPIGGGDDKATSIVIQADQKIVVAGFTGSDFALARYNSDGTLDTTFDGDGIVTTDFGTSYDEGLAIALQMDGKIVVAGHRDGDFALARYLSDGSLDTTFDGDGKVTTDVFAYGKGRGVAVHASGKIIVVGSSLDYANTDVTIVAARYNEDGSLDTTFDGNGTTIIDSSDSWEEAADVAIQGDDKAVMVGYSSMNDFAVIRLDHDGTPDATFSDDGIATTDGGERASAIAIQTDGKIVIAGYVSVPDNDHDFALARFEGDSLLEPLVYLPLVVAEE